MSDLPDRRYAAREALPSRVGVVVGPDAVTCPPKPARWSQRRYRAAYDADPIVVWSRGATGQLARYRVAGPVSAAALIAGLPAGRLLVVAWEADAAPVTDPPTVLLGSSS